jgi:O-antigen/teichoic acid export membrane protein
VKSDYFFLKKGGKFVQTFLISSFSQVLFTLIALASIRVFFDSWGDNFFAKWTVMYAIAKILEFIDFGIIGNFANMAIEDVKSGGSIDKNRLNASLRSLSLINAIKFTFIAGLFAFNVFVGSSNELILLLVLTITSFFANYVGLFVQVFRSVGSLKTAAKMSGSFTVLIHFAYLAGALVGMSALVCAVIGLLFSVAAALICFQITMSSGFIKNTRGEVKTNFKITNLYFQMITIIGASSIYIVNLVVANIFQPKDLAIFMAVRTFLRIPALIIGLATISVSPEFRRLFLNNKIEKLRALIFRLRFISNLTITIAALIMFFQLDDIIQVVIPRYNTHSLFLTITAILYMIVISSSLIDRTILLATNLEKQFAIGYLAISSFGVVLLITYASNLQNIFIILALVEVPNYLFCKILVFKRHSRIQFKLF